MQSNEGGSRVGGGGRVRMFKAESMQSREAWKSSSADFTQALALRMCFCIVSSDSGLSSEPIGAS